MNKKISTGVGIAIVAILAAITFNFSVGNAAAKSAKWRAVGKLGFSAGRAGSVSFAFNPATKRPFVAFQDNKRSDKATVMQLVGNKWKNIGNAAFSPGGIGLISLAFDLNGVPYVAFEENDDYGMITVMKFNGITWETVGSQKIARGESTSIKLAFNPTTNEPYIAFSWADNGNEAAVMKYNGTEWQMIGSTNFSANDEYWPSIAFDSTGIPYLVFTDHTVSDRVSVLKYTGGSDIHAVWERVGSAGFSDGSADFISLAINPSTGHPYVAYSDEGNGLKLTVKKFNGSSWENVGSEAFTSRQADYVSLAFNPLTFEPYVTFQSGTGPSRRYEARVMKYNGTDWKYVGKSFGWGYYNMIAFAPNSGVPYVAYSDLSKKEKVSVKKYSK